MKNVTLFSGALTTLMLSACAEYSATSDDFSPVVLTPEISETARDQVKYEMKDPGSAQFRNMRVYSFSGPGGGYVVCGEVNGKNSMGGYAGFQPFRTSVGGKTSNVYINDLPAVATPC